MTAECVYCACLAGFTVNYCKTQCTQTDQHSAVCSYKCGGNVTMLHTNTKRRQQQVTSLSGQTGNQKHLHEI